MAKRRSKKESHKLLKTAILLVLFIGVWFIYNHTDIPARIQNALRPHRPTPTAVQTVPEPEVTQPKSQQGVLPPPEPASRRPAQRMSPTRSRNRRNGMFVQGTSDRSAPELRLRAVAHDRPSCRPARPGMRIRHAPELSPPVQGKV